MGTVLVPDMTKNCPLSLTDHFHRKEFDHEPYTK